MLCAIRIFVVLLIAAKSSCVVAQTSPEFDRSVVVLRYSGNMALGRDDSRRLFDKSIEILQSSNFNSSSPRWKWDEAKMNLEYARSVSGKHVLVTFGKPATIKTLGGYVSVRELIIGLNGAQVASPVHTVDAEGRIVGHAKYLGQLCVELMELVKEVAARSPIADGNYTFLVKFAEHPNMTGGQLDAEVRGRHIRLTSKANSSVFPAGVVEEGILLWHAASRQWIIGQNEDDAEVADVGGCSDGPFVVDLAQKVFWIC